MSIERTRFTRGLYDEAYEKDACGVGLIARADGVPARTIVENALEILESLAHRGAQGADGRTGDGSGILLQIPKAFFEQDRKLGPVLKGRGYAVGMLFFPRAKEEWPQMEESIAAQARESGLPVLGWRDVPVNSNVLGAQARELEPVMRQVFLETDASTGDALTGNEKLEQELFILRKKIEQRLRHFPGTRHPSTGLPLTQFYIASLSSRTIVYKGLTLPEHLADYFLDLNDERILSSFALVHSRFSTNTLPAWELAHPFRYICHNGEINTIRGNINWMKARHGPLSGPLPGGRGPLIPEGLSDSASLDQAVELMLTSQRSLPEALMTLIPEAWEDASYCSDLAPSVRAFYEFNAPRMEPWDGPAAVCFADGRYVGAALDRNGLRPCRYQILDDGTLILSSEAGVLEFPHDRIVKRGRLGPGQMIALDLSTGRILENAEIKETVANAKPFQKWLTTERIPGSSLESSSGSSPIMMETGREDLPKKALAAGFTAEEIRMVLVPMLGSGEEATSSMGNDTPLAVLSNEPQLLFKYFRQSFAQVTNPPIDPIRERGVMSLSMYLGSRPDPFLDAAADGKKRLQIGSPVLDRAAFAGLHFLANHVPPPLRLRTLSTIFEDDGNPTSLRKALDALCEQALRAASDEIEILVLSDRSTDHSTAHSMAQSVSSSHRAGPQPASTSALTLTPAPAIPALLATAAVHHALVTARLRTRLSIVVDSSEPRDVHHFACLIGYGADAVHPSLVYDLIDHLVANGDLTTIGTGAAIDGKKATAHFKKAIDKGLLKILSKMGISTLQSYCGAQIFEALGLSEEVVGRYFTGTPTRIGGLTLEDIAEETLLRHRTGWNTAGVNHLMHLPSGGEIHYRSQGEQHLWTPTAIASLQHSTQSGDFRDFKEFSEEAKRLSTGTLRGQLKLKAARKPLPLEEVESTSEIVKRFTTGAMSYGALSQEAHETLALAMNRIGAKSNSGEGGEDASRFLPTPEGDSRNSAIKQVASARFGVTAHYLVNARELQIKIAQGAKPGEGGQLPGHKVDEIIARLRHSTPGVTLISPPPHHDIYSIEDLAQLIFDLKRINPVATVSVKLVSAPGVGTIAAGVAKAHAGKILISGDGGGTGASPLSSIKSAGSPWELGLAEAHQTLVMQGLRGRVRIEVDGQLRTGRDVAIAALLGAEEFGFSTAPLVVEGCIMMRKCHLNTCPVGVATQDPELRRLFKGKPEHVIRYFFFVADELREIMSRLGIRRVEEMIGRVDLLRFFPSDSVPKAKRLDLSRLLRKPSSLIPGTATTLRYQDEASADPIDLLNQRIVESVLPSILKNGRAQARFPIRNLDRAVGTLLSHHVSTRFGARGLPPGSVELAFTGTAGQSFGAFLAPGLTLRLEGEANDYVGKGLSGGDLVIANENSRRPVASADVVAGNTCLYGATSGQAYIAGLAGERFAVRNSGATAVVEGVGDHGCEYMTGGEVLILGPVGRNFGAGMSGGIAYIHDIDGRARERIAPEGLEIENLAEDESEQVKRLVFRHAHETESFIGQQILENWALSQRRFLKIIPTEYKLALEKARERTTGLQSGEPRLEVI